MVRSAREQLEAIYGGQGTVTDKRSAKIAVLASLRAGYALQKEGPWAGHAGYDSWFANANNALLGVQSAYDALVPGFEALYAAQGHDLARFYAEVRRLAALPKAERRATLGAPQPPSGT